MLYLEAILLSCLIVCGFVCTVSDFRTTIVPNKIILSGFAIGIPIHVLLLCFDYAPYYPTWLVNMLFADLLAFGMYWYKMWAAGDAKLFMLLYFLFPPRLLDSGSLAYSIVPYMYIFVPALLWILGDTVIRCMRREKKKSQVFQFKNSFLNFCIIMIESTAFSCLFIWLFSSFARENELFTSVIMIVYAFYCSSKPLMKKWPIILTHVVVILLSYLVGEWSFSFNWQSQLIILMVLICQHFITLYNYQLIPTSTVKRGMIPAAETVFRFQVSRVHNLPTDACEELTSKITEEQAEAIRRWEKSATGKAEIWIVRKVPFAIMISIGFILWSLLRIVG